MRLIDADDLQCKGSGETVEVDYIKQGDSAILLQGLEDECIDLVVTSPPYDQLRDYKGFTFDFETIAKNLFRILKWGGCLYGLLQIQ